MKIFPQNRDSSNGAIKSKHLLKKMEGPYNISKELSNDKLKPLKGSFFETRNHFRLRLNGTSFNRSNKNQSVSPDSAKKLKPPPYKPIAEQLAKSLASGNLINEIVVRI